MTDYAKEYVDQFLKEHSNGIEARSMCHFYAAQGMIALGADQFWRRVDAEFVSRGHPELTSC